MAVKEENKKRNADKALEKYERENCAYLVLDCKALQRLSNSKQRTSSPFTLSKHLHC